MEILASVMPPERDWVALLSARREWVALLSAGREWPALLSAGREWPALLPAGREWLALLIAYLIGSIPFGLVVGKLLKGVDIRESGSGNIGTTNAGRVLGRPFALLAFAGDFGKGLLASYWLGPVFAAEHVREPAMAVLAGGAAVLGHVFPIYLRFKGGKAVATGCGAIAGIDPLVFVGGGLGFLVTIVATRFAGLASLVMAALFPLFAWWRARGSGHHELLTGTLALFLLILVRHRMNIVRMLAGTEPRLGEGKPKPPHPASKETAR